MADYIHPVCKRFPLGDSVHTICKGHVWDGKTQIQCHCPCHEETENE